MISTPTRGVSLGRRTLFFLASLVVVAAGAMAFAGSKASADDFTMEFDKGNVNLGFAFQNRPILPAPSAIPAAVSNPDFNPANPVSAENSPTVVNPTGTPLFDYNALDPATFTRPGSPVTTPVNSFTPLGCGTPVTFGIYYAVPYGKTLNPADPTSIIWNPDPENPFGKLLGQALANGGAPGAAEYYRVLNEGAILPEGADPVTFPNPFNPALPDVELTAPYPAANTLWQPYAAGPTGTPVGKTGNTPFAGAAGLRFEQNTLPGGFCPNPAEGEVSGEVLNEETGDVRILPQDFKMPVMVVPNPLDQSPVPITLESDGRIRGTYDAATGGLNLNGPIEVRVLTGLATDPLGSYCALPLPGREPGGFGQGTPRPDGRYGLTTSYMLPTTAGFAGTPFVTEQGLSGAGALTGTFNIEDDAESFGGANCATVNSVSKGLGGIWLSADIENPAPIEAQCSTFNRVGTFPNCLTRAKIGNVSVSGPGKVKRNKVGTYTVKIPNTGEANATNVKVAVKGKGVKASATAGTIKGKESKSPKVKVKPKQTGKIKLTFTVTSGNAGKKSVSRTITVTK